MRINFLHLGITLLSAQPSSAQSVAQSCPTPCDPMDCSMPGLLVHYQLPEFTQSHVHWVSDAIQPSHPLLSPSTPTFTLSQHQGLSKWVTLLSIRWPKYQSFSFNISPSKDTQDWSPFNGLIGSPCSPRDSQESSPTPQFKSINSSCSAFFTVQLLHPYMTIGKTIVLTRWTFVGKVMSLLFNMLSRLNWGFLLYLIQVQLAVNY